MAALWEAHIAAPGFLQLGILSCACTHQHLQTLHTEAPAAACVTAQEQFTALTAHGAVGLIAVLIIHVEELQEAILAQREAGDTADLISAMPGK